MTGIGIVNQIYAERLLDWMTLASVMMNEIAASYDDFMAEGLNECRRHEGQQIIARRMRELADGGTRMLKREHELYRNGHSDTETFDGNHKIQAYYSLRCVPQILGPVYETLRQARRILEEELNSACDNPIVDPDRQNRFSAGAFSLPLMLRVHTVVLGAACWRQRAEVSQVSPGVVGRDLWDFGFPEN